MSREWKQRFTVDRIEAIEKLKARMSAQYRTDEDRKYCCDCDEPIPGPVYCGQRSCVACGRFIRT